MAESRPLRECFGFLRRSPPSRRLSPARRARPPEPTRKTSRPAAPNCSFSTAAKCERRRGPRPRTPRNDSSHAWVVAPAGLRTYLRGRASAAPRRRPATRFAMNKPTAAAAGQFAIGGDLVVNRLGFGAMRVTGPGILGRAAGSPGGAANAAPPARARRRFHRHRRKLRTGGERAADSRSAFSVPRPRRRHQVRPAASGSRSMDARRAPRSPAQRRRGQPEKARRRAHRPVAASPHRSRRAARRAIAPSPACRPRA